MARDFQTQEAIKAHLEKLYRLGEPKTMRQRFVLNSTISHWEKKLETK